MDNVIGKLHELLDDEIDNVIISDSTYINDQAPSVQIHIAGLEYVSIVPTKFISEQSTCRAVQHIQPHVRQRLF
jgi:hypothetical protein